MKRSVVMLGHFFQLCEFCQCPRSRFSTGDYAADPDLLHRMIHPEDRQTVLDAAQRVLLSNSAVTFEHRIQHKDGSIRWVQSLVPCVNPEGPNGGTEGANQRTGENTGLSKEVNVCQHFDYSSSSGYA